MSAQVRLLVGTRKGAFIYSSDEKRQRWELSEPILPGWSVYNAAADVPASGGPRLYLAANHWAWGPSVAKSTDLGKDWDVRSEGLGFPQDMGVTIQNVWSVTPGHESEPGVVYCGTQPAGLFRSEDWGVSWKPVDGINRHPERQSWSGSGGGDSCVHSVEGDPRDANHVYVCISSGGSFVTQDGGKSWEKFYHNAVPGPWTAKASAEAHEQFARFFPQDFDPAAINETHRMRIDRKNPDRLWSQAHVGVYRSDDAGATWADVTEGLPSFHGFPIAVTKRPPDAAFVVPLEFEANNFRVCAGQLTVYRTRDSGKSWQRLSDGLPGPSDYQSVYREGLDTDGLDPEGVYVGTSNGQVFASPDGGDHWQRLPGTLPPILSVTCATW
ncbi:MAG TPA: exo-alpha-sialidase [Dehalococcoidia bacterium]|nr:exo-alpha-sialidase [Dehalococcoidia bacterium]